MRLSVKICGLNDHQSMKAAVENGARYVGLVFYPASPRAVTVDLALELAALVPPEITLVGLFIEPRDEDVRAVLQHVPLSMIQLHGNEHPKRISSLKGMTGLPVMKAIKIGTSDDLYTIKPYEETADWILFDAKAEDAPLPGGNARKFDWELLKGISLTKPWMLAGGLKPENLADAVHITGAEAVDVSSGVEDSPGHKIPGKIKEFLARARQL